jgi:hypothetical protein
LKVAVTERVDSGLIGQVSSRSTRIQGTPREADIQRMGPVGTETRARTGGSPQPSQTARRHGRGFSRPSRKRFDHGELVPLLRERSPEGTRFLVNRLIPEAGLQADLIAIAPAGVWVLDAERMPGEARVVGRGPGQELWIGSYDCTDLIPQLSRAVSIVGGAVDELVAYVPTSGAFCMTEAELPVFRTLMVHGIPLCGIDAITKRLNVPGPIDQAAGRRLERDLALRFPAC